MTAPPAEHARQAVVAGSSGTQLDFHSANPFRPPPNEQRANEPEGEPPETSPAPVPTTLRGLQILTVLNDLFEAGDA